MESRSHIIDFLELLRKNSRINKHQHFHAADRNHFYNNIFGSVAILINVFLGSLLFVTVSQNLPDIAKWSSAFSALTAAACGAIQTFFNFQKVFEGHRKIANKYLEIQRECECLLAMYTDNLLDLQALARKAEEINKHYCSVNDDAEDYPVRDMDHRKAIIYEKNIIESMK